MTFVDTPTPFDPPALDRRPIVGSYTMLDAFRKCEYAMYRRYILKDQPYVESEAMRYGNEAHTALEHRVGKGKVLPEHMRQWEKFATPFDKKDVKVENKFGMTVEGKKTGFFDKDVWYRGKIDVLMVQGNRAYILDWKTANPKYEDRFEIATNAVLVKAWFPQVNKVAGRYTWLKEERQGELYDLSDFNATFAEIKRLMDLIVEKRSSGKWEKMKSGLCGYCSVSDCEHHYVARK